MINEFKFWNVGHGLFYTGHISNSELNFIYDCGSSNKCSILELISDANLPDNFDFMVVSHLHKDHISGISGIREKIKKYYFPYIGENHIAELIIANMIDREGMSRDQYLELFDNLCNISHDSDIFWDGQNLEISNYIGEYYSDKGYQIRKRELSYNNWNFVLINQRMSEDRIRKLRDAIISKLRILGADSIRDLVCEKGIKSVKEAYDEILKKYEHNISSTILIHYPNSDYRNDDSSIHHTVLTGDVRFYACQNNCIDGILKGRRAVFQVPHHGSNDNWKSLSKSNFNKHIFVVPSLYNGKSPSRKTLREIKEYRNCNLHIIGRYMTCMAYHIPCISDCTGSEGRDILGKIEL